MILISTVHVGKNGVTENLIENLKSHFKNHQNLKVVFLRNSSRDKNSVKKSAEEIIEKLGKNYTYRILGFTVFIKKWRRPMNNK